MGILNYIANKIWVSSCTNDSAKFNLCLNNVEKTQEEILLSIIKANENTEYGLKYEFAKIKNVKDFQNNVPLTSYENYEPYIIKIMEGTQGILTSERVNMFELSSGSTAPSKYIPYTKSLKKQFISGINPWVKDLYNNYKELYKGKSYWSITPINTKNSKTTGGIPIGFEEDSQYFGALGKWVLDYLFAVPSEVKYISDIDNFRYVTLLFLLKEEKLSLISVWNPTFLTLLLKPLYQWKNKLVEDLEHGTVTPPTPMEDDILIKFKKKLGKHPERAFLLKQIFEDSNSNIFERIWSNLKLISCWTDANAGTHIGELKRLFPNTIIQGKGLIATEGFVSMPFVGEDGARISIRSHFFEFEELETGKLKLAHEIEEDKNYTVILTTGGGFYRYRLHDIIKVNGFTKKCPRIKFIGKENSFSDLYGEKLNEYHVKEVVEDALKKIGLQPIFYMLAPEIENEEAFYVLYIEFESEENKEKLTSLLTLVEQGLTKNFHYKYCRDIGQLKHVKLFIIDNQQGHQGIEVYHKVCRRLGQRDGDIKIYSLNRNTGWSKEFIGKMRG